MSTAAPARKDFLSVLDFDAGRARTLPRDRDAREGGPFARTPGADLGGARRPSRRDAVRKGVAAHALDIRNRDRRTRRQRRLPASRRRARQTGAGVGRGPQPRALGGRHRHPDLLAARARGICRGRSAPARHQRPERRPAPLPGARGRDDAARAVGHRARADGGLRRRRQQRRGVARARHRSCSASTSTWQARTATSSRSGPCSRRAVASRHGARLRLFTDAADAVVGADAVYTDTWTSMGQEAEADVRRRCSRPIR